MQVMFPLFQFGRMHAIEIRDVACLAYCGERASWWQLMVRNVCCALRTHLHAQARAQSVNTILVGYYDIPSREEQPLKMVINPTGNEERSRQRCARQCKRRIALVKQAVEQWQRAAQAVDGVPACNAHGRSLFW